MADKDYIGKDKVYHLLVCLAIAIYSTEMAIGCALAKGMVTRVILIIIGVGGIFLQT